MYKFIFLNVMFFSCFSFANQSSSDWLVNFNNEKYEAAFKELNNEIYLNHASAQLHLGILLNEGLGVELDKDSSKAALIRASELGSLAARFYMANNGFTDVSPSFLHNSNTQLLLLKQKMKDSGMKFYSSNDEPVYPDVWNNNHRELYLTYSETKKEFESLIEDNALAAKFLEGNKWQVGDASLYLSINKKLNPEYSWLHNWPSKYLLTGTWNYSIPHYSQSQDGRFSLSFRSKRQYDNACSFFKESMADNPIDYKLLFKSCYVEIFSKSDNGSLTLIGSVAFEDYENAGRAYQEMAERIKAQGDSENYELKLILAFVFFAISFFVIKKLFSFINSTSKRTAEKIKDEVSSIQEKIQENRIKRKIEDAVVEETIKQKIKNSNKVSNQIEKAFINEVVKEEVTKKDFVNLSKLKKDISEALDNGEYDKVRKLTELAEKIKKLD